MSTHPIASHLRGRIALRYRVIGMRVAFRVVFRLVVREHHVVDALEDVCRRLAKVILQCLVDMCLHG
jgi:hypothetical protein